MTQPDASARCRWPMAPVDPFAAAGFKGHPPSLIAAWNETDMAAGMASLSDAEIERLGKMQSERQRADMAGSFVLRRRLIADLAAVQPGEVSITALSEGAPDLARPPGWSVTIANKDALTLVALDRAPAEIGADVEVMRRVDWKPMLAMTCSDKERAAFIEAFEHHPNAQEAFFRMWTLKEAALKSTQRGFRAGPKAVDTNVDIVAVPGEGRLFAFGARFQFWTAQVGEAVVSLVRKQP